MDFWKCRSSRREARRHEYFDSVRCLECVTDAVSPDLRVQLDSEQGPGTARDKNPTPVILSGPASHELDRAVQLILQCPGIRYDYHAKDRAPEGTHRFVYVHRTLSLIVQTALK